MAEFGRFWSILVAKQPKFFAWSSPQHSLASSLPGAPANYRLLATGYWLLAMGYWLLAIGYWLLPAV
jgi:hypothetical protein